MKGAAAGKAPLVLTVLHRDDRPSGRCEIAELADEVRYVQEAYLAEALPGADALLMWDSSSTAFAEHWRQADSLKWVHIASAGVDDFLFDDLRRSDVVVTNSRGVFDRPIAEFVLGAVLAFAKGMPEAWQAQRERRWEHRVTERINGCTALVVGTGAIGREIARLLTSVGLTVRGAGRTERLDDPDFGHVHDSARLADLVSDIDYLVNAAPLTDRTRRLIDADVLRALKPSARLINVGRGGTVDTEALVAALRAGQLAGAALDVFEEEPLPAEHALWSLPQVLVTAHLSGDVAGWKDDLAAVFLSNLRSYAAGRPLTNVIDKRMGFVPSVAV